MEYPKLENLWARNTEAVGHEIMPGYFRFEEFSVIRFWDLYEKIDGMNVRVIWESGQLRFAGRTDAAVMPGPLMEFLRAHFNEANVGAFFGEKDGIIFGEGYGGKIQNGSGYSKEQKFRAFDVLFGKQWMPVNEMGAIEHLFGIKLAPYLATVSSYDLPKCRYDLLNIFEQVVGVQSSIVSMQDNNTIILPEGVVAKTSPQLYNKYGNRVMFKLKMRDLR